MQNKQIIVIYFQFWPLKTFKITSASCIFERSQKCVVSCQQGIRCPSSKGGRGFTVQKCRNQISNAPVGWLVLREMFQSMLDNSLLKRLVSVQRREDKTVCSIRGSKPADCICDLLWDPSNQFCGLKDHLAGVAALHCVPVNQAADPQVMRIWRRKGWTKQIS